jgi:hypothetical protein
MSIKGESKVSPPGLSVDGKTKGGTVRNIIVAITVAAILSQGAQAAGETAPPPPPPANQQPNFGCPGPEYQQFKFWLGEWRVTTTQGGKFAGDSTIALLDQGCVIFESWKSGRGGSGHSLNVYDQADGKWHQTWIDATGDQVHYIGIWTGGKLEFRADDVATPQKQNVVLTMTFEPRSDGTIRQSGTMSTDGGKTFQPSFDLTYTRKK